MKTAPAKRLIKYARRYYHLIIASFSFIGMLASVTSLIKEAQKEDSLSITVQIAVSLLFTYICISHTIKYMRRDKSLYEKGTNP